MAEVSKAKIDQWKKEHGRLHKLTCVTGTSVILRRPNSTEYDAALVADRKKGLGFASVIYNSCKLHESKEPNDQEKAFFFAEINEMFTFPSGETEKLEEYDGSKLPHYKLTSDSGNSCVVRQPNLKELDRALLLKRPGGLGFGRAVYDDCLVESTGDPTEEDLIFYYNALDQVVEIMTGKAEEL